MEKLINLFLHRFKQISQNVGKLGISSSVIRQLGIVLNKPVTKRLKVKFLAESITSKYYTTLSNN